jgi:hypothetical protein
MFSILEKLKKMTGHKIVECQYVTKKLRESGLVAGMSQMIKLAARWWNLGQLGASCPAFRWDILVLAMLVTT